MPFGNWSMCCDGPATSMLSGPSMFIKKLHRDRKGLASAEMVLGMPVFFIMLLALKHAFAFSMTRIDTLVAGRSAAWNQARNGLCTTSFDPGAVVSQFLKGTIPDCEALTPEVL